MFLLFKKSFGVIIAHYLSYSTFVFQCNFVRISTAPDNLQVAVVRNKNYLRTSIFIGSLPFSINRKSTHLAASISFLNHF